jgi:hypothetical protein
MIIYLFMRTTAQSLKSELHFFEALTHGMQVSVFINLLNQGKYDLANEIYQKLDLTQEDITDNIVKSAQYAILQKDCTPYLRQEINQLSFNFVKNTLLQQFKAGELIGNSFSLHPDNILPVFSLAKELEKLDKARWINLVMSKTYSNEYITFNQEHSYIFDEFSSCEQHTQLRLLSQSNILDYMRLPKNYFKTLEENQTIGCWEMERVEKNGFDPQAINCHYPKVAVILHALFEIDRPDFKAFLNQFKLLKKEKESLFTHALADQCLFDIPIDKLTIFLEHFNLSLPFVLNEQFKFFDDDWDSEQLNNLLRHSSVMNQYASFFENHIDQVTFFSSPQVLISEFDSIYEFFDLENGPDELLEFLKFTSYATKGQDRKTLLSGFYQTLFQKNTLDVSDYFEEEIDAYLAILEKDILLCDDVDNTNTSSNSNIEQSVPKKGKKIKL